MQIRKTTYTHIHITHISMHINYIQLRTHTHRDTYTYI